MVGENSASAPPADSADRTSGPVLLLAVVMALMALCWLLYRLEAGRILNQQEQRESTRVALLAELMRSKLQPITVDLKLLAVSDGLRAFLDKGSTAGLEAAARLSQFVSANHPSYDQVRFIDQAGQEVLRFNRGGEATPAPRLQNKASRGYFQKANQLPSGMFYVSALDLNVEDGQVEQPLKPMLRLAAPVFDTSGRRRGVVVINYLAADLFDYLQQAIPAIGGRLRLLDTNGYWLKAAEPAMEWGFMLPDRAAFNLARSNPDLWASVSAEPSGQRLADTLFTWIRMRLCRPDRPARRSGCIGHARADRRRTGIAAGPARADVRPAQCDAHHRAGPHPAHIAERLAAARPPQGAGRAALDEPRAGTARARTHHGAGEEQRGTAVPRRRFSRRPASSPRSAAGSSTRQPAKAPGRRRSPASTTCRVTLKPEQGHRACSSIRTSRAHASRQRCSKSLADGSPYDLELEFVSARGVRKWVRTISRPVMQDGRVVRMRGALQDITERKLAGTAAADAIAAHAPAGAHHARHRRARRTWPASCRW